jgi:hypothetical protein
MPNFIISVFLTICLITANAFRNTWGQPKDPFANSGCDCDRFCNYECAINATDAPVNMTFYRMTMKDVNDLSNKNTGDIPGDTSFVISRKDSAFYCR